MKIKVQDKSTGAQKVYVRVIKKLADKTDEELVKLLDLKNEIVKYHYDVENEAFKTDDIYSDELIEYVDEVMYEYSQNDSEADSYKEIAERLVEKLQDEVVEEIMSLDEDAVDYYNTKMEAMKGEY